MRPYETWLRRHLRITETLEIALLVVAIGAILLAGYWWEQHEAGMAVVYGVTGVILLGQSARFGRDAEALERALQAWQRHEAEIPHLPARLAKRIAP